MKAFSAEDFQLPDHVRQQLGDCVARDEIPAAFQLLRQQRLPFAPCLTRRPEFLATEMFAAMRQVAGTSLSLSIGLTMHLYALCALRTFPLGHAWVKRWRRAVFLRHIGRERLLIANVGGNRDTSGACLRQAVERADGYTLSGVAPFMSLATVADYAVVSARLSETQDGLFAVRLQPRPRGITFCPPSFGNLMPASCTRRVEFADMPVPRAALLHRTDNSPLCHRLFTLQRAWLHFLTAAAYLGAAQEAIRRHCPAAARALKPHLATAYQASHLLAHALAETQRSWCPLAQLEELSNFAKYTATDTAAFCLGRLQDLVIPARRADLARARSEILLGAHHPPNNREIESHMLALASA